MNHPTPPPDDSRESDAQLPASGQSPAVNNRGLIFDLDGTLVNSLQGITASLNRALALSKLPEHPPVTVREFIGNGSRILIERATPTDTHSSLIDEIEATFKADYDVTWSSGTLAYDGVFEVLALLQNRGHPLAVLSNKPHAFTTAMVSRIFSDTRFACVLGQRPGIAHKPDPAGAMEIARELGMPPENFSLIGDSTMDIETAKNAGMHAVAVTWGFHDRDRLLAAGADVIIDTPGALAALFQSREIISRLDSPR